MLRLHFSKRAKIFKLLVNDRYMYTTAEEEIVEDEFAVEGSVLIDDDEGFLLSSFNYFLQLTTVLFVSSVISPGTPISFKVSTKKECEKGTASC